MASNTTPFAVASLPIAADSASDWRELITTDERAGALVCYHFFSSVGESGQFDENHRDALLTSFTFEQGKEI